MVEDRDLHDLLSTGIWTTQRAKSPKPHNSFRADQSFKLAPLESDDISRVPRVFNHFSHKQFPPPPSVEDEEDSVAKETNGSVVSLNDEEPKFRGTVDQLPIILPVHEHNPERRFVLVPPTKTSEECLSDVDSASQTSRPPAQTKYTANSKAPLDPKPDRDELPPLKPRRSRTDLPRIVTEASNHTHPRPPSHILRSRSATCIDQGHRDASPRDYFSARPGPTLRGGDALLTPVVKHATKGRDRAYWNFNTGGEGIRQREQQKPHSADHKGIEGYARTSHGAGPGAVRRLHSDMEVPQLRKTVERHSSHKDEAHSRSKNGPQSPSLDRRRSPPRLSRRETSPARPRTDSHKLSRNRSSYHGRSSPPRESVLESSSDECREHKPTRRHHREHRKSTIIHDDRSALLSPAGSRPYAASTTRSKPPSPMPSPKISQETFHDYTLQPESRSASTFHVVKDKRRSEIRRPVSPTSSGSPSSPRSRSKLRADDRVYDLGRPRASSRTPSTKSSASSSKPVNPPLSLSTASLPPIVIPSVDRKRQTMPPTPKGSLETSPQPPSCWQTDQFDAYHQTAPLTPRHSGTNLEQSGPPSVVSYRRYSQDVSAGTAPGLPDCPRKRPRSGYTDWYTLPRYDSFNICPSCYEQVFLPTAFRDSFVPASYRSRDKEIACDLGTSPWYRIAWLMTRKYRRNDLRLLQGIHDVSVKHKIPCYGPVRVARIWYSILDPDTRRCISNFKVCSPCAESVQVLFPSLTGIFVPLDRPAEARSGQCSLHFAPNRTRFLTYFDILEDTHDRAMAKNSVPNMERLVERIDSWAGVEECPKDEPQRHGSWYTMAHIPEMTVCEECFLDVVYPELVVDASAMANGTASEGAENSVVRNFYHKPQLIKSATVCQMASPAMRDLFRRACRREDGIAYLDSRLRDRLGLV
ncbi:hypothetical protein N0V82_006183 [Gnomoniopsis sp. IMI 355080]|nr:hypothetical protein N0V82_006183 [Gnomoniopsis sp. IMI 355080]